MIATELPLDLPDGGATLGKVAPILARVTDLEARSRVLALDRTLTDMAHHGYEIGTPAKARQATLYTYAEWHISIKHAGVRCVLSFFVNEFIEVPHGQHSRKQRSTAACRR
ncbi:hypothetical protein [Herbaspirillum sp. ST 5-3]|uniref:hypothetical protein n=1 Tax=Oxalobacteraceae TaxID=75682 RepID=UPI0010A2BFC2|nr:hypothetical protein [Herbaspirillum sp. ST 5-3]